MTAPSGVVKQTAKTALCGNWLKSIVATTAVVFSVLICIFIADLVATVSTDIVGVIIMLLLSFFLLFPLFLGALYFFRRILWGQDDSTVLLFRFFSSATEYRRAIHLSFLAILRLVSNGLLLFSPCLIVRLFASNKLYSLINVSMPVWAESLVYVSYFLGAIGALALFFVMLKIYLAPFLFVADEDMDVDEAINMSQIISKRTDSDFFWLCISFLPLILISVFVIPLIFTLPYFICSYLVHCRFAVAQYNRDVDRFNTDNSTTFKVG